MFVSVGSGSQCGGGHGQARPGGAEGLASRDKPLGATWGNETDRADVLAFDPRRQEPTHLRDRHPQLRRHGGRSRRPATCGARPTSATGSATTCVPDYVTRVREGAFYGWPWYYIGATRIRAIAGARPDLKDKVTVPDVLIQAHSASLEMTFYDGRTISRPSIAASASPPSTARGTGPTAPATRSFACIVKDGVPTGEYEDFVTGFVVNDSDVWGRPVGVRRRRRTARCCSPRTATARSGASPIPADRRRPSNDPSFHVSPGPTGTADAAGALPSGDRGCIRL